MAAKGKPAARKRRVAKPTEQVTLRQALDYIDAVLAKQNPVSQHLWDVLTGLRGPDDPQKHSLKPSATVHIRRAAFPRTADNAAMGYANGADFGDFFHRQPFVVPDIKGGGHIEAHLWYAADRLGLIPVPPPIGTLLVKDTTYDKSVDA